MLALFPSLAFGQITVDVNVSKDGASASTTIASTAFTTAVGGEQLLAFVSADFLSGTNTTVKSMTGGGLTWGLLKRANGQQGTAEVWGAFAAAPVTSATVTATLSQKVVASITVMSFSGVNAAAAVGAVGGASAASGAPTASLITTGNNSLVLGVGNDWDTATARTVGVGQTLIHQRLTSAGDTYWVQGQSTATPSAGTTVTINDTAPTKDRFNLAIVELLAAGSSAPTYTITGTITPSTAGSGASVALSGASTATTLADSNGNFSFTGLAHGAYTVTPAKSGYAFTPASQPVTINEANQGGVSFTGQAISTSYTISGTISGGPGCAGCAFVQSTHSSQAGHKDWPTLKNVKAGDALVYIGEFTNWVAGATVNMTDSHNNIWHRCDNNATSDFVEIQDKTNGMSCHYTVNIASWPTITAQPVSSQCVTTSCTQVGGSFFELALPATATATAWGTPLSGTSTSGSNNVSCGSITLTQSNDFLMCDFDNASGTSSAGTTPVSFALRENVVTAIETGLYAGSGMIVPTATLNSSGIAYTAFTVAFGTATGGAGAGATVTLGGASTATTVADANGNYSFTGLPNGAYTVTPSNAGYTFNPSAQSVTVNGADQTGVNFTAIAAGSWSISGTISPLAGGAGATVSLSGASSASTVADTNGNYSFTGLANGVYTVTPANAGYSFTPLSQSVTINGADQTGINFAAVGVAAWTISGTLSPVTGGSGATVTLSGAAAASTVADANGNYAFTGLANGAYTVTPAHSGYTFSPSSQPVTVSGANQSGVNFTATPVPTWTISGTLSPTAGGAGATVSLSGASTASTVADANGNYSFTGLANGAYTVTPTHSSYTFSPSSQPVTVSGANQSGVNFTATPVPTWTISGTLSPTAGGAGATVSLSGVSTASTVADGNGNYSFTGLANGAYSVTPTNSGYSFTPASQPVTVNGADASNVNFTAAVASASIARDVTVSANGTSASTTITTPVFTTATGNEEVLALIATDFLSGTNTIVKSVAGGGLTWSLVKRVNAQKGSSEIWGAFAGSPLNGVTVTATLSQSVVASITVMSFTGVNSTGAIGAVGGNSASSGAPTASLVTTGANSLVIGVGNDYDKATARTVGTGQILINQSLTSAGDTYWVQMLASSTGAKGSTATLNDTAPTKDRFNFATVEVLAASGSGAITPPQVSLLSPGEGATLAGMVSVSASAYDAVGVVGVQFLLDGSPLGSVVTSAPYTLLWNSSTVSLGNHTLAARATDGGGLSTTSAPVTINVGSDTDPAVVGQWSTPVSLPAVAVNLILLRNNKVLFYQDGSTPTVWDYVQNTFTTVPYPNANLFCSGHALLKDGRVLVVGGYGNSNSTIGIANAEIFDPVALTWTKVPDMQYRRWYPNAATLSDGRVLVTAGWQTTANTNAGISEIYDPSTNTWTSLTNANNPFETYPFIYLLPNGHVIHIGGSEYATDTDMLDLNAVSWSVVDPTIVDGGSATMYWPNKFVKAGSAADSQNVGPSSNTTFTLDLTQAKPSWVQTAPMVYPRSFMNLTMLPDGTALATGGETDKNGGDISKAVYAAELWSPQTQTWSTMASMHTPREYHGTALLLPDGRVLESGMGADFGNVPNELSAEFFSPAYLFKGARPTITQAPTQISYNTPFFVQTPDAASVSSVVLIRTGAVTHFFDENERFLPVSFTQADGGLTVTSPVDGNTAPPGYYMLFIVNSAGVPAIAPFVQLQ